MEVLKKLIKDKNPEALSIIAGGGVDVNAEFEEKYRPSGRALAVRKVTLLLKAVESTNYDAVEQLIKYGANVNLVDGDGRNALYYLDFGMDMDGSKLKIFKLLIKNGIDVNSIDKIGATPLMYACQGDYFKVIELLKVGADIDIMSNDGFTARQIAEINGDEGIVNLFINAKRFRKSRARGAKSKLPYHHLFPLYQNMKNVLKQLKKKSKQRK